MTMFVQPSEFSRLLRRPPTAAEAARFKAFLTSRGMGQLGQAGPNRRGGLPTKWSNDFVFNPETPGTIYSVPIFPCPGYPAFLSKSQYRLPTELGLPKACATWIWDPKLGTPPWPGAGPDPRVAQAPPTPPTQAAPTTTYTPPVQAPVQQTPSDGRAGPNRAGGLTTKYGSSWVFNADTPGVIYSVPIVVGIPSALKSAGYVLPSEAGLPAAAATFVWPSGKGTPPWPGTGPDPRTPACPQGQINDPTNPMNCIADPAIVAKQTADAVAALKAQVATGQIAVYAAPAGGGCPSGMSSQTLPDGSVVCIDDLKGRSDATIVQAQSQNPSVTVVPAGTACPSGWTSSQLPDGRLLCTPVATAPPPLAASLLPVGPTAIDYTTGQSTAVVPVTPTIASPPAPAPAYQQPSGPAGGGAWSESTDQGQGGPTDGTMTPAPVATAPAPRSWVAPVLIAVTVTAGVGGLIWYFTSKKGAEAA